VGYPRFSCGYESVSELNQIQAHRISRSKDTLALAEKPRLEYPSPMVWLWRIIFMGDSNHRCIIGGNRYIECYGATANLTVLNVLLVLNRSIQNDGNHFAAIGAVNILVYEFVHL